jgi:hypothetical protein
LLIKGNLFIEETCLESFEYQGEWWLPQNPDRRKKGDISFSEMEGIRLRLNGSFRDFDSPIPIMLGQKAELYPTIHGFTPEGRELTIVDAYESHCNVNLAGYPTQECAAPMLVEGGHFKDFKSEKFSKVFLRLSHLPEWAGFPGFSLELPPGEEDGKHVWHLMYSSPDEIVCTTSVGKVVFFCIKQPPHTENLMQKATLSQETYIRVEPHVPMTFDDLQRQYIQPIQRFMTLATGEPNYMVSISLTQEAMESGGDDDVFEVFYNQSLRNPEADENIHPYHMLFTLKDIRDDLDKVIDSWLRLHSELGPVCDLYFSVQFASHMFLEGRFLNMVHAAETYHRRCYKEHGKGPVLRKRMTDLLVKTGVAVDPLVQSRKDFVDKVVDTRNYLTHYDPKKEKKAAKKIELYKLTETLSYIVQVCLLIEAGISARRCADLLVENPGFKNFKTTLELL